MEIIEVVEMATDNDMRGKLAAGKRQTYALAGNATLTIRSSKTGNRFTYRIRQSEDKGDGKAPVFFVALMNGPDNDESYIYLGTIFAGRFRLTAKSKVSKDAPSAIAFDWFSRNWESEAVEVWHEGSCGRCGRKLTVPESIESGIGPVCERKA